MVVDANGLSVRHSTLAISTRWLAPRP
jgi:hypothetical protein